MAMNNRERVRKGLDHLNLGLIPFVERELKAKLGPFWINEVTSRAAVSEPKETISIGTLRPS